MDKMITSGLIIVIIVGAVAGVLLFNNMNPKTTGISSPIMDNQTGNNTNNINESNLPQSSITLFALSTYSGVNSQYTPGPSPGPVPDPMAHVISLFDAYLNSIYNQSEVPSMAVVMVQNGKIIYMKTLGVKDLASGEPVDENTLFMIGSATKQFTATNIAQLVSAGLMSWDDPITKYYNDTSEFQLYDPYVTGNITIRDCLCHRSGLPDHNADGLWAYFNYTYPYNLHQLRYVDNNTVFRSNFSYNNMIYSLPAYCAAKVKNTTWNELIKEELLDPLNMFTATTTYNDFMNSPDHVTPYVFLYNGTLYSYEESADGVGPAGSIACSISEMANWLKFQIADTGHYNGVQIVSKNALDETRTGQMELSEQFKQLFNSSMYGFGWIIGEDQINHNGDLQAFHAHVQIYPSRGLGIAIFTNGGSYAERLRYALTNKSNDLINGLDNTDPWLFDKKSAADGLNIINQFVNPAPPITNPYPLNTYVGVYYNAFYGNVNITQENNSLVCYYGNNSIPYELNHVNDTKFLNTIIGAPQGFIFEDISNNTAYHLRVTGINDDIAKTPFSDFNRTNST